MQRRTRRKVLHPARQELREEPGAPESAGGLFASVHRFLSREVWLPDLAGVGFLRSCALKLARVAYLTGRGFVQDNCLFRASGLTYITVLSLVPLLAFSFSIAKGFGGYEALRDDVIVPFLDQVLPETEPEVADAGAAEAELAAPAQVPPGEPSSGAAPPAAGEAPAADDEGGAPPDLRGLLEIVLETVDNTDFAKLGFFGLAILLYTVIKLIGAVEQALNDIWGVPRSRSVVRKVSDYLTMVVVTPIFLFVGLGLFTLSQTESALDFLRNLWGLDRAIDGLVAASPFFVVWIGLTLLYLAIPNTRVRWTSAVLGGAFGAALTLSALIGHNRFQIGVANANAIYAGFAALPIFLFFVYLLWTAVLLGAELAAAHQSEPAFRSLALAQPTDQAARERIALRATARIAAAFRDGSAPLAATEVAHELGLPARNVVDVLAALEEHQLILAVESDERERAWVPARGLDDLRVADVLAALREGAEPRRDRQLPALDRRLEARLAGLAAAVRDSEHNRTLEELLDEARAEAEPAEADRGPAAAREPRQGPDEGIAGKGSERSASA